MNVFFLAQLPLRSPLSLSSISRAYIFRVVIGRRHYTLIAMRRNVRTRNSHLCMCRSSWWSSTHKKYKRTRDNLWLRSLSLFMCVLSTVTLQRARCGNSIFFLCPISIAAPMVALIILLSAFCSGREFKTRVSFDAQEFPTATCNSFSGPRRVWLFALCRVDTTQKIYNCAKSSSDRWWMGNGWQTAKRNTFETLKGGELNATFVNIGPYFFGDIICECKNVCDTFNSIYGHLTCAEIKWNHCWLWRCVALSFYIFVSGPAQAVHNANSKDLKWFGLYIILIVLHVIRISKSLWVGWSVAAARLFFGAK